MIACVRIPYFAVAVARPSHPDSTDKPLILAQYKKKHGTVYAACEMAMEMGVRVGMSLSRARAFCPEADIKMATPSKTRRALEDLLQKLSDYSAWVQINPNAAQTAIIYVDIGRMRPKEGEAIAQQIIESLLEQGLKASVGLASGKFTAYVAAANVPLGEIKLIHKGKEAEFLAPMSTGYLPLGEENAGRFALFGLRRIEQVLNISRDAMIEQFGKVGARVYRLALGEDDSPVKKYVAPIQKTVSCQFEPPIEDRLILENVLATLVGDLSTQLLSEGLACKKLLLSLRFDNHTDQEVERLLKEPISRKGNLYLMVQPLLDRFRVYSPIAEISLRVDQLAPIKPRQFSLFDPPQIGDTENSMIEVSERYDNCIYGVETHGHPSGLEELQYALIPIADIAA